jgi:hypothetical protein
MMVSYPPPLIYNNQLFCPFHVFMIMHVCYKNTSKMGKKLEFHLNIILDDYNLFYKRNLHSLQNPPCANKWLMNLKLPHEFFNHVNKLFILWDGKSSFKRIYCAKVPLKQRM